MDKKFIKLELMGSGSFMEPIENFSSIVETLSEWVKGLEEHGYTNEEYVISCVELTQKQYDKLPEFTGF